MASSLPRRAPVPSAPMLQAEFERWMVDERGYSYYTRRNRAITVEVANRFCKEEFGRRLLLANQGHIRAFLARPRHPRTRNKNLADLRCYFRFAGQRGYRTNDPTAGIERLPEPRLLPRPVPEAHALALLQAAAGLSTRTEAIVGLMLYAGLRRSEVAGMTWSDVDLDGRNLRVMGKGSKERMLPVCDPLADILARWLEESGGIHWLFPSTYHDGRKHLGPNWIWKLFGDAAAAAGIKATPHRMRHSFATAVLRRRKNVREVQALLGHASLQSTQIYTGLMTEDLMESVQSLKTLGQSWV